MLIVLAVSSIASLTSVFSETFFKSAARRAAFCSGVLGPLSLEKCLCTGKGLLFPVSCFTFYLLCPTPEYHTDIPYTCWSKL